MLNFPFSASNCWVSHGDIGTNQKAEVLLALFHFSPKWEWSSSGKRNRSTNRQKRLLALDPMEDVFSNDPNIEKK
jgi:hypothetical protein